LRNLALLLTSLYYKHILTSVTVVLYHITLRHMYVSSMVRQTVRRSHRINLLYGGHVNKDTQMWKSARYSTAFAV